MSSLSGSSIHQRLTVGTLGVVAATLVLLGLGVANVTLKTTWNALEEGVFWSTRPEGVTARLVAPESPAGRAGVQPGDVLYAIDGVEIRSAGEVSRVLHGHRAGDRLVYWLLRARARQAMVLAVAPVPRGNLGLYYVLACVGAFGLLVGAAVRLRRPTDPGALQFFCLSAAFFGVFVFSFAGKLDRLDWLFYVLDDAALLLLAPAFLHFTTVFPERRQGMQRYVPLFYLPAVVLGGARVLAFFRYPGGGGAELSAIFGALDRVEPLYVALYFLGAAAMLVDALRGVRSIVARRQLRWIVWGTTLGAAPFAFGYAVPYAFGVKPSVPMELTAIPLGLIPLTFACAIVRYRLMDVEVIVKRSLVYAAAVAAILGIYLVFVRFVSAVFLERPDRHNTVIAVLATLVVVLLARPVKDAIQQTLDRAFYRDRYDYRRALVGFARDLNADLDLFRLSERLVARIVETLLVDRMALLLASETGGDFSAIRTVGWERHAVESGRAAAEWPESLRLERRSALVARLAAGHAVALDDPITSRRIPAEEAAVWRDRGLYYFFPCVSKEGTIAALALGRRATGEPLNSEDLALLAAVAGQVATALENGRLYRQLRLKADEHARLKEFSENIVESLDDGLAVVDLDGCIVRWNTALEQLYGLPRAGALGHTMAEIFPAAFLDAIRGACGRAEATTLYKVPLASRDGRRRIVNMAVAPLRSGEARRGQILIFDDITERMQLEEQLQLSEKMVSIGLLAAGVAHEVNTPLTGISSFTQILIDGTDRHDPKLKLLEKIERQTFRAAKIVNSLLNFSRPATAEFAPVDLNGVVGDVLSLLEHQFKVGRIKVRRELSPDPVVTMGIESKLQQIFLNLFLNARDAMPKGGWLTISTAAEGGWVSAEVADTGCGISEEHLSRIYDPFFTTKAIGQGTGLGLSITYGIVQEHGGSINCESAVGQGTRFRLRVPAAARASAHVG